MTHLSSEDRTALEQHIAANPADADADAIGQRADMAEEAGDADARKWRLAQHLARKGFWSSGAAVAAFYGVASLDVAIPDGLPGRNPVSAATSLDAWLAVNEPKVLAAIGKAGREGRWLALAAGGDVSALLAHPTTRVAAERLAKGEPAAKQGARLSDYAGRKAIAAAKKIMAERLERRAAKKVADDARRGPVAGRIRARWISKLRGIAVAMGCAYHSDVKSLYASKYGDVLYGRGGQEITDRERYSKGWHNSFGAASCRCAGARLDSEADPRWVIVENFRGTEVARLPLPGRSE